MREIKFRAWDPVSKKMSPWFDLREFGQIYSILGNLSKPKNPKDLIFLEYTGLKDKNGKEIYEGDVVKHRKLDKLSDGTLYGIGEILTDDRPHKVHWWCSGFYPFSGWIDIADLEYEVIGNIYENPELIK